MPQIVGERFDDHFRHLRAARAIEVGDGVPAVDTRQRRERGADAIEIERGIGRRGLECRHASVAWKRRAPTAKATAPMPMRMAQGRAISASEKPRQIAPSNEMIAHRTGLT